jgi:hypothetical protein
MESQCSFDLYFLYAKDMEPLFMYLLIYWSFVLLLRTICSFAHLLIGLFFWCLIFGAAYLSWILIIYPMNTGEDFLPF